MDANRIDDLKAKHGDVWELTGAGESIVVRRPSRGEYKAFRAASADERRKLDAPEQLLRQCIVHPEPDAVNALLDRKPALADVFAAKVLEIAGLDSEASAKKA